MKRKGAHVDTFSPAMNGCGDKLVTNQEPAICGKSKKRTRGKPVASGKFGSAVVPIYRLGSGGRISFMLSFYLEGKRQRRSFTTLDAAKKEAQLAAQRIQGGRQEMNDLRPHDRERRLFVTAATNLDHPSYDIPEAVCGNCGKRRANFHKAHRRPQGCGKSRGKKPEPAAVSRACSDSP